MQSGGACLDHPVLRIATLAPVLAAVVLGLAACGEREEPAISVGSTEPEFEITGAWQGRLTQKGMKPFTVEARIRSLALSKDNLVRYSRIDCAGTWEYLGASATAYRFRETIDRGRSKECKGTGTVELRPLAANRVAYVFRGGGVSSAGELMRRTDGGGA